MTIKPRKNNINFFSWKSFIISMMKLALRHFCMSVFNIFQKVYYLRNYLYNNNFNSSTLESVSLQMPKSPLNMYIWSNFYRPKDSQVQAVSDFRLQTCNLVNVNLIQGCHKELFPSDDPILNNTTVKSSFIKKEMSKSHVGEHGETRLHLGCVFEIVCTWKFLLCL